MAGRFLRTTAVAAWLSLAAQGLSGTYGPQAFTFADGTTSLGDGTVMASSNNVTSVQANALRLTQAGVGGSYASFKLADIDPGKEITAFDATLKVRMTKLNGTNTPADGWTLNFGAIPAGNGDGEGGFVMTGGIVISFDTYDNGGDTPSIQIYCNGVSVGNFPQAFPYDTTFRSLAIHWDAGGLDVTYNGVAICADLATPGFVPTPGNTFAFSGRTGGATQDTYFDDLHITTTPDAPIETGGPIISEFVADNSTLEDEDLDKPDWIEIYNGQNASVNLSGWKLINVAGDPTPWTLPAVTLGAYQYKVIYASGKNRTNAAGVLHTDFTLQKEAGYLALVRPNTSLASMFNHGAQVADVSYGEEGPARTLGYMAPPTPGAKNTSPQAAGPPAEDLVWSRDGGLIAGSTTVAIAAPVAAGSVIRYTADNIAPGASSPIYNPLSPPAAFTFATSTTLRARVLTPGRLPGPVSSRTFLQLDSSLTNYNGSSQVFSSSLPIVVLDSFGVPVDSYSNSGAERPHRLTYGVVIDKDPLSGRASMTGTVNFQGRSGTHVRGESSSGFDQRQYAWELWDNENNDKDVSLLGLPSESDWILYAPYTDKTLMRNLLIYSRMRELRGDRSAMRTKFVEVFFNQEAGQPVSAADYRGVYVLIEKIKRGKDRVDIAKLNELTTDPVAITGGYLFKKDKPGIGNSNFNTNSGVNIQGIDPEMWNPSQQTYLQTYLNNFETALNGGSFTDPATGYQAYVDRDTFIDNQWFVEIAKQIDGYRISTYFHKDRGAKMKLLPLWDYNLSLFNADYNGGDSPTGWYYSLLGGTDYPWYPRLHQDPGYRVRHWDRYWELRRGIFSTTTSQPGNVLTEIDAQVTTLLDGNAATVGNNMPALPPAQENAVMRHFRKWQLLGTYIWPNPPGYETRTTYQSEINAMKTFVTQRLAWIDDQNFVGTTIYRPPNFNRQSGIISAGQLLSMSAYTGTPPAGYSYAAGTIYYTTNGTDPRATNGAPAGSAYSGPLALNTSQTVKARLYNGGNWSPMTTATFIVNAVPAAAGNLAISEIHYHPLAPTAGESAMGYTSASMFEFIELQNVGAQNVDLTEVQVLDAVGFYFAGITDPAILILAPGARAILVGNKNAFLSRNGSSPAVKILGEFSGNLSNAGEQIIVLAKNTSVIQRFTYLTDGLWPTGADGPGYSLVLVGPQFHLPPDPPSSWRISASIGGNPGTTDATPFTGSALADVDADGLKAFLEYSLGTSDSIAGQSPIVASVVEDHLTLTFPRSATADDVAFTVEYSSDLATWETGAAFVEPVTLGPPTAVWRAVPVLSGGGKHFLRLRATTR